MVLQFFRALGSAIFVLFLVVTLTFFMLHRVPGGPFDGERNFPAETCIQLEKYYQQNEPILVQYGHYLGRIFRGDLGPSYYHSAWTVNELIRGKFWVSFELGFYALLLAILVGVPWGTLLSLSPGGVCDRFSLTLTTFLLSIPSFVLATLVSYFFCYRLAWLPPVGWSTASQKILPVLTLSLVYVSMLARLTRKSMQQEWGRLYVRTAQAKGLSLSRVLFCHVFPNGIQPVITYLGPTCAGVLSGTFVIETIFNIPGLGRLFVESIGNRDYPVVSGIVLFYAMLILLGNFLADCLLLLINPKLRD